VADNPDSAAGQAFYALAQAVAARVSVMLLAQKQVIPLNIVK
jgi:hypothetical protein